MTTQTDLTVAKTILNQLGGNKFIVMTGAKNLHGGSNHLSFKIGRNLSKATHITITLTVLDTYKIEFIKCAKFAMVVLKEYNDIYAEQLRSIFTEETGMYTNL